MKGEYIHLVDFGHFHKGDNLRNHAYSNILKVLQPNNETFQKKKNLIFFIFLLKT